MLAGLRAATAAAHEELDRRLGFDRCDRDRYVTFLRASSAVVAPLELALARWLGPDEISRASALRADLEALGATPAPPAPVPELRSLAEAMGAAYVVEGSALGGSVLARTVAQALGLDTPRAYLTLRADQTGARWRDFIQKLDAWGASASADARTAAECAARATFGAYSTAFEAAGALA